MAISKQQRGRGSGGGGLHFRDPADSFADNAARTLYFTTTSPLTYLQFALDRSLAVIVGVGAAQVFYTYIGNNLAYDNTKWVARLDAVRGPKGDKGFQGVWYARIFINAAVAPVAAPVGGSIAANGTITPPAGWVIAENIVAPPVGEAGYESITSLNSAVDAYPLVPTWSFPFEVGGAGGANAAAAAAASAAAAAVSAAAALVSEGESSDFADEADVSADAALAAAARAEAGANLVSAYNGPVKIVNAVAFVSDGTDIVVPNWRNYDELAITFLDSSGNAETYQCSVFTASLEENGKAQIAVEQNAQIEITATDASDSLNFNFAGAVTGFPSTSDTISIWGLRVGVGPGGPAVPGGPSAPTNLDVANRGVTTLDITSSTGDNVTVPAATAAEAGLMVAADKTALTNAGGQLRFGAVDPVAADGNNKDNWINTALGTLWNKAAGAWTKRYTFPSGGGGVVVEHDNFFGWSADRVIEAGDFAGATSSDTEAGALPAQLANAYIWFARKASLADPTTVTHGNNPANQINFYQKLAGIVTYTAEDYEIWITYVPQSSALGGETVTLGGF